VPPRTDNPYDGAATAANFAAAGVFTTSTCENDSACAVTAKSTPGRTSPYVAVSPSTTGLGNDPGHDNTNVADPTVNDTNAADPPPENVNGTNETRGLNDPSAFTASLVSTGTHDPERLTRTGTAENTFVNDPSGLANSCDDSVVRSPTSTLAPDAAAAANALPSGVPDDAATATDPRTPAEADTGNTGQHHRRHQPRHHTTTPTHHEPRDSHDSRETRKADTSSTINCPCITGPFLDPPQQDTMHLYRHLDTVCTESQPPLEPQSAQLPTDHVTHPTNRSG
jgi:hypothetical protein